MNILVLFGHGNKPGLLRMLHGIEANLIANGHQFFHAIDKSNGTFTNYGFDEQNCIRVKKVKKIGKFLSSLFENGDSKRLRAFCNEKEIDLIISYTLSTLPVAVSLAKKCSVPCAAWLHNHYNGASKRYKKNLLKRSDAIISVSDFILKDAREYLGSAYKKLFVAYNAIEVEDFIAQADRLELPDGLAEIGDDEIVIGMIAVMDENKNPQLLLKAVTKVKEELPHKKIKVLLVGRFPEAEYEGETRKIAETLGFDDDVVFMGFQSNVSAICSRADILVYPSFREAFSLSSLEAMAWGKPVVASKAGGIPEVVKDGATGILCEPGNVAAFASAIKLLVKDKELRTEMGEKGRERVAKMFSMKKLGDNVEVIFKEIVLNEERVC